MKQLFAQESRVLSAFFVKKMFFFSVCSSELPDSKEKKETSDVCEPSPVKRKPKAATKRVLEDSDDEGIETEANDDRVKPVKMEQVSTDEDKKIKVEPTKEKNDKERKDSASPSATQCNGSPSNFSEIPKRKTGMSVYQLLYPIFYYYFLC